MNFILSRSRTETWWFQAGCRSCRSAILVTGCLLRLKWRWHCFVYIAQTQCNKCDASDILYCFELFYQMLGVAVFSKAPKVDETFLLLSSNVVVNKLTTADRFLEEPIRSHSAKMPVLKPIDGHRTLGHSRLDAAFKDFAACIATIQTQPLPFNHSYYPILIIRTMAFRCLSSRSTARHECYRRDGL